MASNVPFTLSAAANTVDKAIQRMWIKRAPTEVENYKKICNVVTGVTDYYVKESSLSDLGEAARITENAAVVGESPVQGYDKTWEQVYFGKMLAVTRKMWKFGIKPRALEGIVDELKRTCIRKRERLVTDRITQNANTTYTVNDDNGNYSATISGGNGVAFGSSSQTREDGGTANNNLVYDGSNYSPAAGYLGLKALHRTSALVLSPKGNQLDLNPSRIFAKKGGSAAMTFKEILGAIKSGKKPETFSNDGSAVPEFELVELPYMSDSKQWAAVDPSYINDKFGLQYMESQPVQLKGPNVVFKTGEIQYMGDVEFDIGHNDYRGWFFSNPS